VAREGDQRRFLETRPGQSWPCALDHYLAGNRIIVGPYEDPGRYLGHRPRVCHGIVPC